MKKLTKRKKIEEEEDEEEKLQKKISDLKLLESKLPRSPQSIQNEKGNKKYNLLSKEEKKSLMKQYKMDLVVFLDQVKKFENEEDDPNVLPDLEVFKYYPKVTVPFTGSWLLKKQKIIQAIVCKKDWDKKVNNQEIVDKWEKETPEIGVQTFQKIIKDLKSITKKKDLVVEPILCVLQADHLIGKELKEKLIKEAERLEGYPKDWHPNSKEKVLNLVHPSLYCLVPGQTYLLPKNSKLPISKSIGTTKLSTSLSKSRNFVWIPSDVSIDESGKVKILSYVNNLHPKRDKNVYPILEGILEKFIPLFEKSLSKTTSLQRMNNLSDYIFYNTPNIKWKEINKVVYKNNQDPIYNLKGRNLQFIFKLSNTELSSDSLHTTSFEGGNWHLEGLEENIVATGIYYYTVDNITKSDLSFRQSFSSDPDIDYFEQEPEMEDEEKEIFFEKKTKYKNGDQLNQNLGSITAQEDRCIVFPNFYQHRVSPFGLHDENKSGKRRILVFWLINPHKRIYSTSDIPPQQSSWFIDILYDMKVFGRHFPKDCIENIVLYLENFITHEKALLNRIELMEQRSSFNSNEHFEMTYDGFVEEDSPSYCEH